MAAVLASGTGAVLARRAAAALWRIRPTARATVEVSVPSWRRSRPGVELRQALIPADEITVVNAIPVTGVPRTLFDLAAVLAPREVRRAAHEAEVLRLRDRLSLADLVTRYPHRRGVATIKALLAEGEPGRLATRSELEDRFLDLVDDAGLPRPERGALVEAGGRRLEVDFVWRSQRLAVELDGHAVHSTRRAFEVDRERDRALQAAGWRAIRITWRQLHAARAEIVADLGGLLSRPAAYTTPNAPPPRPPPPR